MKTCNDEMVKEKIGILYKDTHKDHEKLYSAECPGLVTNNLERSYSA